MRSNRARAVLTVVAACAAVIVLAAPSAQSTVTPSGFFGVGSWSYPSDLQSAALGASGLRLLRGSLGWDDIQPTSRSGYNWTSPDALANQAAQDGYDLIFALNGCAAWACGATRRPPTGEALDGPNGYREFVAAAVARYAPDSSFWNRKPRIPRVSWQVWNEVNGGAEWPNPTPADYAGFLVKVSQTIKTTDPQATVLMSGLDEFPGEPTGMSLTDFLAGLYQQPGFASSFDVAAVHAYATDPAAAVHVLDEARRIMLENGDGSRPLWVTEMSWASGGPAHPFTVSALTQNAYLRQAWGQMLGCRARWNLDHVLWFALQDASPQALGLADYWGVHNGLLDILGVPKPAYASFLEFLGPNPPGTDVCALPGGNTLDITDPDTAIRATPGFTNDTHHQPIAFDATENDAGVHFQCSPDGSAWKGCSSPFDAANSREGDHQIRVRAFDAQGNVDATPAVGKWQLDLSPPNTLITDRTSPRTSQTALMIAFSGKDAYGVAGFQCRQDGSPYAACTSPYTTPALRLGDHEVDVRAVDLAGNIDPDPVRANFTIVKVGPPKFTISRKYVTIGKKGTGRLAFTCSSPGDDACVVTGTLTLRPKTSKQRRKRMPVAGTISGTVPGTKSGRVTITINRAGLKRLGRKKGTKVVLTLKGYVTGLTGLKSAAGGLVGVRHR